MREILLVGFICVIICVPSHGRIGSCGEEKQRILRSRLPNINKRTTYDSRWTRVARQIDRDPILKRQFSVKAKRAKANYADDFVFGPPSFNCDVTRKTKPATSVHELSPNDISVVAAMGDSITHGYGVGADKFIHSFSGNRGESWSIGGKLSLEDGVITLANVLREFNSDLKGYSVCYSSRLSEDAWLNVAQGGATSRDMPGQAQDIVDICKMDSSIDNENDWKVITLLVGGNDLCASCINDEYNATMYAKHIEEAMDILHAHLPKAFVNIVPMFDITPLKDFSKGVLCRFIIPKFCPCGTQDEHRSEIRNTQLQYYDKLKQLVDSGKYDTRGDFTVVIQPMFVNLVPPQNPDTGAYYQSFLSYDCFHPSLKAHQAFAYALWNTMMTPVAQKPLTWDALEENPTFICPTEGNPYFATSLNGF